MNILIVCQYYYPENFQINDISAELVRRGHKVMVLTGLPNYPEGIVPEAYRHGKRRDEVINGVRVLRCFEIGRKKGIVGLTLNYLSYAVSAWVNASQLKEKFDVVYVYQLSPVLMAIPAIRYKKRFKVPLVLYCNDIWPESMKLLIRNEKSLPFKIIRFISKKIYNSCDKLLLQTSYFIPYFEDVHKISRDKIAVIPQFAADDYLQENFFTDNGVIDFVFLGNIGIAQNLLAVLKAVKQNQDLTNIKLHIVGDGSCLSNLKNFVAENKLEKIVQFYGRRPLDEMPIFYRLADVCIVSLKNNNLTGLTLPGKVQGYMAAGKMILGMIDGAASEVIKNSDCGFCADADDVDGFAEFMRKIVVEKLDCRKYGENGRNFFKKHFTRNQHIDLLENILREII